MLCYPPALPLHSCTQRAVVEWRWFKSIQGGKMSQLGLEGWGQLTSSSINIVSRTWLCTKWTRRLDLLVAPPPLHPLTGHATVTAIRRKDILYSAEGGGDHWGSLPNSFWVWWWPTKKIFITSDPHSKHRTISIWFSWYVLPYTVIRLV